MDKVFIAKKHMLIHVVRKITKINHDLEIQSIIAKQLSLFWLLSPPKS